KKSDFLYLIIREIEKLVDDGFIIQVIKPAGLNRLLHCIAGTVIDLVIRAQVIGIQNIVYSFTTFATER
ncbi:MAG TPA: hypothetical protein VKA08_06705, partial [Balneolales bacterium]|nr:hypothetical protein [Balneolales bacterium]